jgi:methyl-accepting chemotaxis protein
MTRDPAVEIEIMRFANLSILWKVMTVVALLTAVSIAIAVTATYSLRKLDRATIELGDVATAAALAPRINLNIAIMNRGEVWVAANPDPQEITNTRQLMQQERSETDQHLAKIKPYLDESQTALLRKVETLYADYLTSMENTLALAEKIGSAVNVEDEQKQILGAAKASHEHLEKMRQTMVDMGRDIDERSTDVSQEAHDIYDNMRHTLIGLSIAGVLLGVMLGFSIAQFGISKPLRRLVEVLRSLADGNLEVNVPGAERRDEVGAIASTTLVFKENMIKTRNMEAEAAAQKERTETEKRQMMQNMADSFEASVKEIVQSVSTSAEQLQGSASTMSSIAEETARQATVVASATSQASGNVQTVATATEELSSSISEITRQVSESAAIAQEAVSEVERTNSGVAGLTEAAGRIGSVAQLIQDIASQTNLLALNATIEAARAGEAGKGFAVVASEVKNLAAQTARATEEITEQIAAIQQETSNTVTAIRSIGGTVIRLNEIASGIAAAVEEQSAATQEIARNVQEAAIGTEEVSRNITGVNDAAAEAGNAANEVLDAAKELSQQSAVLSSQVDAFIGRIRAG